MTKYVIQYKGSCGDNALWWRPERAGYTTRLDEAGRYEEAEARSIERIRGLDKAWPVDQMYVIAHKVVDVGRLLEISDEFRRNP
jgi:hypothetical protein